MSAVCSSFLHILNIWTFFVSLFSLLFTRSEYGTSFLIGVAVGIDLIFGTTTIRGHFRMLSANRRLDAGLLRCSLHICSGCYNLLHTKRGS
jgi:hypothetical protein